MTSTIKFIAKWEGGKAGNPVLFFPEYEANAGRIACYAHTGQHSEACINYYRDLRNPITLEQRSAVQFLVMEYQNNYLENGETLARVWRDTGAMRKKREARA